MSDDTKYFLLFALEILSIFAFGATFGLIAGKLTGVCT